MEGLDSASVRLGCGYELKYLSATCWAEQDQTSRPERPLLSPAIGSPTRIPPFQKTTAVSDNRATKAVLIHHFDSLDSADTL